MFAIILIVYGSCFYRINCNKFTRFKYKNYENQTKQMMIL